MFLFKKKQGLIEYFLHNKFTFPISKINDYNLVISHADTKDIDILFKLFPKLKVSKLNHKKYDYIFILQLKNDFVMIIDEHLCDNLLHTLSDIKNSQLEDWTNYSKIDNVIYPKFRQN